VRERQYELMQTRRKDVYVKRVGFWDEDEDVH
jgi:hypothetical protein